MSEYINTTDDSIHHLNSIIAIYSNGMANYYTFVQDVLQPGQLLTEQSVKDIFKFINSDKVNPYYEYKGIIPENVIYMASDKQSVLWYTKPCVKQLLFAEKLEIKSGNYPLPYILFHLKNDSLLVYALKEKPVDGTEQLYQAPFLNVNSHGAVCMGSSRFTTKSFDYKKIIQKAETGFFQSLFTHSNTDKLVQGNYTELMNIYRENKYDRFFNDLLIPYNKLTINSIINEK